MGNTPNIDKRGPNGHEPYKTNDIDVDKEIVKIKQILDKNPENGTLQENLGQLYMKKGLQDEAERHFLKAYQMNTLSPYSLFTLGTIKEEKREYIDAVEYFKEVIEKEPNNPEPYHKLAEVFLTLKEVDKAIHFATECNKKKQNDPDLSNLIGLCYLLKNNLDKAQEYLITANLLDSNHFRALNNLGNLNRRLNKLDRAIEYYKLALRNMNSFYPAYLNLGLAYFEKGDIWNGLTNIKESLKGGVELQNSVNKMGFGFFLKEDILYNGIKFYHEGQYEIAAVFLEKAYQSNQNNVVTLYYIALLKYELKDYQAASTLFNEVLGMLSNEYAPKFHKTVWFKVLFENCKEYIRQIMNRVDDTINLSELHPVEVTPEPHTQRQDEQYSPPIYNNNAQTEVQRNLSQLSISQIAIEPNFVHNHTDMSPPHS